MTAKKIFIAISMALATISVIALLFFTHPSFGQTCSKKIKIGVVDTGLNLQDPRFQGHLCATGHKNFVPGETLEDLIGHGTHVAGLIQKYAESSNYCMLIYKYYRNELDGKINMRRELLAFKEAVRNGATIINFSGGGPEFSEDESLLIRSHPKTTFVVAAGNDGNDLDIPGNEYYPASLFYKNIQVVGSVDGNNVRARFSNYGVRVKYKEIGQDVLSYLLDNTEGMMSGTSMSAAIHSGKLVLKNNKICENEK